MYDSLVNADGMGSDCRTEQKIRWEYYEEMWHFVSDLQSAVPLWDWHDGKKCI